ncbi:uncharacterized protein LOC144704286 [Wolffia australiana]
MGLQVLVELPLEAAALGYAAAAAVAAAAGTLWTWLAVLAAALGFWRFRSAAVSRKSNALSPPPPAATAAAAVGECGAATSVFVAGGAAIGVGESALFRFSAADDDTQWSAAGEAAAEEEEEEEEEMTWQGGGIGPWRGDLGWYEALDMGALNGSVVRLWDDEKMVAGSPRRRRAAPVPYVHRSCT